MSLLPYLEMGRTEAGCDEAGRGCLAGPVVAAAVILPADFYHPLLNDSKQLSESKRLLLREIILQEAESYAIGICTPAEIDKLNILWASVAAMHKALQLLTLKPAHILVDGNRFKPFGKTPHTCVVKGDSKFASIAAASILAKTTRDAMMENLHEEFPVYGWNKNKGYPTQDHREGIKSYGACVHHRKSFALLPVQTRLEL
ncbi:MAG: ribonuclease HII [Flavobacteriales bacterium]|nr:ribonuclease HII [Flavobacteriales bacterium]